VSGPSAAAGSRNGRSWDVIVIGGGTAGAVIASRLTEDPSVRVALIEAGPSDAGDNRVLLLRNWLQLLGSELDYDYTIEPQPRGNSHIRHSRARVLGGCSSHNTMIAFRPLPADLAEWRDAGGEAVADGIAAAWPLLATPITPVAAADRNPVVDAFLTAATSLGLDLVEDFNAEPFVGAAGYFSVGYDPATGVRSSSSVAYLHPHLDRPNLDLILDTRVLRLVFDAERACTGVEVRSGDGTGTGTGTGTVEILSASAEVVVCAGAIDTPRLLLLSGIGPAPALQALGLPVVADVPGVGEHLLDHPESVITWETVPLAPQTVMGADAGLFVRRDPAAAGPDLMFHFCTGPYDIQTAPLGYPSPEHGISLTPNIPKARSVGRIWLDSADPDRPPRIDFRYFTDPDGHDEQTILDGLKLARRLAATPPLSDWILKEVAPGPDVDTDEKLSAYGRAVSNSVYHPMGTAKLGTDADPMAVVDGTLKVRGVTGVRIADASIFPTTPTVNPMVSVLLLGEHAATVIRADLAR
jgi:choline dehydrogenase-like flavoprotein